MSSLIQLILAQVAADTIGTYVVDNIKTLLIRIFTAEISTNEETAYRWLVEWLSTQDIQDRSSNLSVEEYSPRHLVDNLDKLSSKALFIPGTGLHLLHVEDTLVLLERTDGSNTMKQGDLISSPPRIILRTLGSDTTFLKNLILKTERQYREQRNNKLAIHTATKWGHFSEHQVTEPRSWDSVVLDDGLKEFVLKDLNTFLNSKDYYTHVGIPYRRGYLLYGSPGCGKSSFVKAVASELRMDMYVISLTSGMEDSILMELLLNVPSKAIILIEDVEAAYGEHQTTGDRLTRTGFLNALDGILAGSGKLVFMTTNFKDSLDEALMRPGRVDVKVELKEATANQVKTMALRFIPEWEEKDLKMFVDSHTGKTPAEIQDTLLKRRQDGQGTF